MPGLNLLSSQKNYLPESAAGNTNRWLLMKYADRHEKYPNTVIISYPFRWGGQLADRWMWLAELNGEVLDYDSKRGLIADAIKKNLPYVVLRVHRNGNATNIACGGLAPTVAQNGTSEAG